MKHQHILRMTAQMQTQNAIKSVAVISDTHGHLHHKIADIVNQCDVAVHAGDIGNADVIQQITPTHKRVYAVRGNNDVSYKWPQEDKHLLHSLPEQISLELPGGQLVAVHGHKHNPVAARHALLRKQFCNARVIVYGHSHRLCIDQDETPWVINPGAAGTARTFGGPSCIVLHVSHRNWRLETIRITDR